MNSLFLKIALGTAVWIFGPAQALAFEFNVLHTNDLHSYFEGSGPDGDFTKAANDGDIVQGHYARLAYQIQKEKKESPKETLLLDAGDFFAGTLFHALAPSRKSPVFPEADFFRDLGYDATTFGNHEFDARDEGLEIMLKKWGDSKVTTPILATNAYLKSEHSRLKPYFGPTAIVKPYIIKVLSDGEKKLKVGLVGLLGPDGALMSLGVRETVRFRGFEDENSKRDLKSLIHFLKPVLRDLKKLENVDVIIGLLHGGHPEDRELLEALPEINLLVAGHTHQVYPRPIRVGKSLLVQAGSFGKYLGKLSLNWDGDQLNVINPDTIIEIDDRVPVDPEMYQKIQAYKEKLEPFLEGTGFRYNSPIFKPKKTYLRRNEPRNPLGILVASGIKKEFNKSQGDEPIALYFSAMGLIRKSLFKDQSLQLSDIFKILAIGFDKNLEPGGKVVSFYLEKSDVRNLIRFMDLYGSFNPNFTPVFSDSVTYKSRWWGIPFFNRLGDLKLNGQAYKDWPPRLRVASSQYVAAYLPKVRSMSHGLLQFVTRDKSGRVLSAPRVSKDREYVLFARSLKEQVD